ncbi:MAG: hypothetical protein MUE52_11205 [Tabrizicola sp.]|jgi:hypothetical protein|nr:hypothetical protein [Tabrizicola sp.]
MRTCLFALALIPAPALADFRIEPRDCPADVGCLAAVQLTRFSQSPSVPVVVGDALVLVGIGPDDTNSMTSLLAVEITLSGTPALAGVTELDATTTERQGRIEVAPDGQTYAVFTVDERDHLNRNRLVTAIQFFDEMGERQGRVGPPYTPDWPEDLEGTPGDLLSTYRGTNALTFAEGRMSLRFGRFLMSARIADGAMELVETAPGSEEDGIEALANLLFDPTGGYGSWVQAGVMGFHNYAGDGRPPELGLARTAPSVPPDVLGRWTASEVILEPNEADYQRDYAAVTISPDGALLAAIRLGNSSCDPGPSPFDVVVYDTRTGRLVWTAPGVRTGVVQLGLAFAKDNRLILTEAQGAVAPPCGPTEDPSLVRVTIYDPRPAP